MQRWTNEWPHPAPVVAKPDLVRLNRRTIAKRRRQRLMNWLRGLR